MAFSVIKLIYVDFRMCRAKDRVKGSKWGGLLPMSSLGSRRCSSVATGGDYGVHGRRACTYDWALAQAWAGMSGKAY